MNRHAPFYSQIALTYHFTNIHIFLFIYLFSITVSIPMPVVKAILVSYSSSKLKRLREGKPISISLFEVEQYTLLANQQLKLKLRDTVTVVVRFDSTEAYQSTLTMLDGKPLLL